MTLHEEKIKHDQMDILRDKKTNWKLYSIYSISIHNSISFILNVKRGKKLKNNTHQNSSGRTRNSKFF